MRLTRESSPQKVQKRVCVSRRLGLLPLIVLIFGAALRTAGAGEFTVFGPKDYVRAGGKPAAVTDSLSVLNPNTSYTLRLDNRGRVGQFTKAVSSAVIRVNGVEVIMPHDLNQRVGSFERPIQLSMNNSIEVEIRSAPGSGLTIEIVGVDNDPPIITARRVPPANAAGWNNTQVVVVFECSDLISGIASCPAPVPVDSEGAGQVISGTAVDNAGNSASTSITVNIDWTPPTIVLTTAPPANAAGWNNTPVAVDFACSDTGSGVASCTEPLSLETEAANQVVTGTAVDVAGNSASSSVTLNIDRTPPSIAPVLDPLPNAAGWNNSEVTVTFECQDPLSGVEVCPGSTMVTTDGQGQEVHGLARDNAGNSNTATASVNLDMTPPSVFVASPYDGAWLKVSPANITGTVEDVLSGIDSVTCNGDVAIPSPPHICDVEILAGHNPIEVEAVDVAGNSASSNLTVASCENALEVATTDSFTMIWNDRGSGAFRDGAFYKPNIPSELEGQGYQVLGHFGQGNYGTPQGAMLLARELTPGALREPAYFAEMWHDHGSGAHLDGGFWHPVGYGGYRCIGLVTTRGYNPPSPDEVRCVREELLAPGEIGGEIWIDAGSGADRDFGSWEIDPDPADVNGLDVGAFWGRSYSFGTGYAKPSQSVFVLDARWVNGPGELSETEIEEVIQEYGPVIQISEHEQYFLDDPEVILDDSDILLEWALVRNEWSYDNFQTEYLDSRWTSSANLVEDAQEIEEIRGFPPYDNDPDFRYWLKIPETLQPGDLGRARTFVHVRGNPVVTEIQFWLFYPFNGPGRVRVCHAILGSSWSCDETHLSEAGRHYGDWEMVSLTVDNETKTPLFVTLSQHGHGERIAWGSVERWANTSHPVVYAAKFSHANYAAAGYHFYQLVTQVDKDIYEYKAELFDMTDAAGPVFLTWEHYEMTSGDTCDLDQFCVPDWLQFERRWGQYEHLYDDVYHWLPFVGDEKVYTYKEIGAGPTGPAMKPEW